MLIWVPFFKDSHIWIKKIQQNKINPKACLSEDNCIQIPALLVLVILECDRSFQKTVKTKYSSGLTTIPSKAKIACNQIKPNSRVEEPKKISAVRCINAYNQIKPDSRVEEPKKISAVRCINAYNQIKPDSRVEEPKKISAVRCINAYNQIKPDSRVEEPKKISAVRCINAYNQIKPDSRVEEPKKISAVRGIK